MTVITLPEQPRPRFTGPEDVKAALKINFSGEQLTCICAPLEPGVIIAGAGAGKTTVMAARVVWLVGSGQVSPEEVLGLTFTRKAAAELSAKIRSALIESGVLPEAGYDDCGEQLVLTYDAFASRVVSEHALRLGYETDPRMITGAARFRLAAKVVAQALGPFEQVAQFRPQTVTERMLKLESELQSHLLDASILRTHADMFAGELAGAPVNKRGNVYASVTKATAALSQRLELADLVGAYQQLKRDSGVVEFADQMVVAARLVREVPEIGAQLRGQFRIVLLDEYQDTSSAQAQLLSGLFSGPDAKHGRGHAVTAVGDPFQAIYGWRGAAASNILSFHHEFPAANGISAQRFSLTVNRRSGPRILTAANELAADLRVEAGMKAEQGLLVAPDDTPPGEIVVGQFLDRDEELAWLADTMLTLHTAGPAQGGVAEWAKIAVLARRNADIACVYDALTARDIPCEIVGLGGLLGVAEIADIVAVLTVLDDVTANPELIRLLTGPRWAIGRGDLALLGSRARELAGKRTQPTDDSIESAALFAVSGNDPTEVVCLLDAVDDLGSQPYSDEARARFADFSALMRQLRRHSDEPVLDLVRRVVTSLGLDVELAADPDRAEHSSTAQLAAFLDAVGAYADVDMDASVSGLLAYLQAEAEYGVGLEQAVPTGRDSVKLLTVHKSKGLEWPAVFLPGLVDETFPNPTVNDDWVRTAEAVPASLRGDAAAIPQLGEASDAGFTAYHDQLKQQARFSEDRLVYVAVTRAREKLFASAHWWRPGTSKSRVPSPYFRVIKAQAQEIVCDEPAPAASDTNPYLAETPPLPWPAVLDEASRERRVEAAAAVRAAMKKPRLHVDLSDLDEAQLVASWDQDMQQLLTEARRQRVRNLDVMLPPSLSATQLIAAQRNPAHFAETLKRPLPHAPSRRAAFGTRFHEWVQERFGSQIIPGIDDHDPELVVADDSDEAKFAELCARFDAGQFGGRAPESIEYPFTLVLNEVGQGFQIPGRIDAVYRDGAGWLIVDWKTSAAHTADPLQLAIYRLAWAELNRCSLKDVRAGFYYVHRDQLECPPLATRAELVAQLTALTAPPPDNASPAVG